MTYEIRPFAGPHCLHPALEVGIPSVPPRHSGRVMNKDIQALVVELEVDQASRSPAESQGGER